MGFAFAAIQARFVGCFLLGFILRRLCAFLYCFSPYPLLGMFPIYCFGDVLILIVNKCFCGFLMVERCSWFCSCDVVERA